MRLYILGPAFRLPSVDAECLAAVALLRLRLDTEGWNVVPTHDQTRRLPHLIDGDECVDGFDNIAHHLSHSTTILDEKQSADATALSSFLQTHAQTLLDISLYVSSDNYTTTRTAFSTFLPWYANYTLPPKRRHAARNRTDHLGISSIDVDDVHDDLSNRPQDQQKPFEEQAQKRASLLLPSRKGTVKGLLQQTRNSAVFKLHGLADDFFAPLQDMLGEKEYFLGTSEPTEVDCLVYGYLALMLFPALPQDWLAKTMRRKYERLVSFTERMHARLGLETEAENVISLTDCKTQAEVEGKRRQEKLSLPWLPPLTSTTFDIATNLTQDLISHLPFMESTPEILPTTPQSQNPIHKYLPPLLTATATSLALAGYYAFTTGLLVWPHGQATQIFGRRRLADYGHLGAALAGTSLLGGGPEQRGPAEVGVGEGA